MGMFCFSPGESICVLYGFFKHIFTYFYIYAVFQTLRFY